MPRYINAEKFDVVSSAVPDGKEDYSWQHATTPLSAFTMGS